MCSCVCRNIANPMNKKKKKQQLLLGHMWNLLEHMLL